MEIRVNEELCVGCGTCIPVCPTDAIRLFDGLALLDKTVCTLCRACVDACPQGAMTLFEAPVEAVKPVVVRSEREGHVVVTETVASSDKSWLAVALAFAGREILPRLAEALVAAMDRTLAQTRIAKHQVSQLPSNPTPLSTRNSGVGYRRRHRASHGLQSGKGQNRSTSRGKCSWRF